MCGGKEFAIKQRKLKKANQPQQQIPPPPLYTMIIKTNPTPKQILTTKHKKKVLFDHIFYRCSDLCTQPPSSNGQYIIQRECKPRSTFIKKEDIHR